MIDLFFWTTPNNLKVTIALEELELPYRVIPVSIPEGEQRSEGYLRVNPNGKLPAIVDHDGPGGAPLTLAESGAILLYLAEKTGRLLPADAAERWTAVQWLMFQMAAVGPMLGQLGHFAFSAPEEVPYALDRFARETKRLYRVVEGRLGEAEYLAGGYSVADIACFPWLRRVDRYGIDPDDHPNLSRWIAAIAARPAVQRGLAVRPG